MSYAYSVAVRLSLANFASVKAAKEGPQ
jgi:hypothetical protein